MGSKFIYGFIKGRVRECSIYIGIHFGNEFHLVEIGGNLGHLSFFLRKGTLSCLWFLKIQKMYIYMFVHYNGVASAACIKKYLAQLSKGLLYVAICMTIILIIIFLRPSVCSWRHPVNIQCGFWGLSCFYTLSPNFKFQFQHCLFFSKTQTNLEQL